MALAFRSLSLGPFATNAYLITCEDTGETAIVDVGFEVPRVARLVVRDSLRVRYLLNTHGHYDHVAGMRVLQEEVGGTYWLHPADQFLAESLDAQGAAFGLPSAQAPSAVHPLTDGQDLPLGRQWLKVIHTPGHSPGSVTFGWEKLLWVGDLLFSGSIGRTDLPGGSLETLVLSVRERIFPLGDDFRVLPGHGPETTTGFERLHNPFVGEGRVP